MNYSKSDFDLILAELERELCEDPNHPLPCGLFDTPMPDGRDLAKLKDGRCVEHVADACNLASSIQGIHSLLKLAKEEDDCERLSRVLVRELGSLREAVQDAEQAQIEYEEQDLELMGVSGFSAKPEEKNIRLWADILKHPAATIIAHQCFSDTDEAVCIIDTAEMRALEKKMQRLLKSDPDVDGNSSKAWRKVWKNYSGKTVQFNLPSVDEVEKFFRATAERIQKHIDRRRKLQTDR